VKNDRNADLRLWAYGLTAVHFIFVVLHSVAHEVLGVKASPAQLAFIVPVIILAPVAAAILLPRYERSAAAVLAAAMAGAFWFGLYYHFVARTADHVAHVHAASPGEWANVFHWTAVMLTLSEMAATAVAVAIFLAPHRPRLKAHAA
jgi:hypothetical protein